LNEVKQTREWLRFARKVVTTEKSGPASQNSRPSGTRNRRKLVNDFIARVGEAAGRNVTRTDIWKVAGYKSRKDFEQWQRRDPKTTQSAEEHFARVLRMLPDDFIRILDKKRPSK
jgi:hypothetical protein